LRKLKIIISGGGTGGHLFPAIAIANALKVLNPNIEFLFVGAQGRMEMEKVPAAGYRIEGLWISGFQRKFTWSNFMFPFKVISSLRKARKIIQSFQPDIAIGTGGYASGPVLRVASKTGIPTLIQEQNSFPGMTNKILGKEVSKICVAYEGMEKYFPVGKIILTGNPIRSDIVDLHTKRARALDFFGLDTDKKIVLVIGGSQGARTINESIEKSLQDLLSNNIQVIWQTGSAYFPLAQKIISKYPDKGVKIYDFITKMDFAYASSDVVVSRAGAISLSELVIAGKPCILIPSPNVAEDHQTKNAMNLVKNHAAIMLKDGESREKLGKEIILLINDESRQKELQENIKKMALPGAAEKIAHEVLKLIK
jgi:UDP-N-acetylglucosamine--N-acetylmuramyl-(pentapeptide) pyrophosphoryl-undecaprenol N-acetylglucosamine transferase